MQNISPHKEGMEVLLGKDSPHTILFLFQNKNEIRATGGFIGSVGLLTFDNGVITDFSFRDVYDFDGQLKEIIPAPKGFDKITNQLFLRDANFTPDFPTSAQRILDLLKKEGNLNADSVIAIDQSFLETALKYTGNIDIQISTQQTLSLNAENAIAMITYLVEGKFLGKGFDGTSPKQFLGNLVPQISHILIEKKDPQFFIDTLKLIDEKHLLAYSTSDQLESFFTTMGVSGNLYAQIEYKYQQEETQNQIHDFFMVSHANVGANKSDEYIHQDIIHETSREEEVITSKLSITREHTWSQQHSDDFNHLFNTIGYSDMVGISDLKKIMGAGENLVYTEVILPKGIFIKSVNGIFENTIDISRNDYHTTISFFFPKTAPGKSNTVEIEYIFPEVSSDAEYYFTGFSQPGMTSQTLKKSYQEEILFNQSWLRDINIQLN